MNSLCHSVSVCLSSFLSFFLFLMRPCCNRTRCRVSFIGARGASTCITNEARSMLHAATARVTDPIVKSISCRTRSSLAALRTSQVKSYYSCSSIKADRRIIANGLSFWPRDKGLVWMTLGGCVASVLLRFLPSSWLLDDAGQFRARTTDKCMELPILCWYTEVIADPLLIYRSDSRSFADIPRW